MLLKKVDSIISKLDKTLLELEKKELKLKENIKEMNQLENIAEVAVIDSTKSESVRIDEVMSVIRKMQKVSDESKLEQINKMLSKIDADKDGQLQVDDVLKVMLILIRLSELFKKNYKFLCFFLDNRDNWQRKCKFE